MKRVTARREGLTGVFETLAEQHGAVWVLLTRMQDKPEKKPELWPEIRRELLSHECGETLAIYPALREYPTLSAFAEHHDQEAGVMESLIYKVDAAPGEDWRSPYGELVDSALRHADEEEREIFPKAQAIIGEQGAKDLEVKFLAAKKQSAGIV